MEKTKDCVDMQTAPNDTELYDDEINLIDYLLVLWKHKWFISLVSILLALIVGLLIFQLPSDYTVTYVYNLNSSQIMSFETFEQKFFSGSNLRKIILQLEDRGFNEYIEEFARAEETGNAIKLVNFQFSPAFINLTKIKNIGQYQDLKNIQEASLEMHITSTNRENIEGLALILRRNFEQIMLLHAVKKKLSEEIIEINDKLAIVQREKYPLKMQLQRKNKTLEKFKSSTVSSDYDLQFSSIGDNTDSSLGYQILEAQKQVIDIEETIQANQDDYSYYSDLLKLNKNLFANFEKLTLSPHPFDEYELFLNNLLANFDQSQQQLIGYLSSYIKELESIRSTMVPSIENPTVYSLPKGMLKKTGTIFAIALIIAIFSSFLAEGFKEHNNQSA